MDSEEVRLARLTRIGRETIIKYGTYDMVKAREIGVNHPFYVQLDSVDYSLAADDEYDLSDEYGDEAVAEVVEDPEALAAQIISSNFKTGMSQEEVDAFMRTMV